MEHIKPGHTHPIVCLDTGHSGEYNRSPAVPEYYESDMNWTLHLLLKAALERYGIEATTTRETQGSVLGVYERVDYVVVYVPQDGSGDEIGQILADGISLVMGTRQVGRIAARAGSSGDYYGVIRGAAAVGTVGLILEHSFHTNTLSTHWLLDAANLTRLAEEEAVLIARYFDVLTPEVAEDILYRVQTGAFRVRANAEAHLTRVKAMGFDAYITSADEGGALYRVQTGAFRVKANAEAYLAEVKATGLDAYIAVRPAGEEPDSPEGYTLMQFVLDIQNAVGAAADGIVGPETLRKLPTLSRYVNSRHAAIAPVQQRLYALGYTRVGRADGIAGSAFEAAVKAFQSDNNSIVDGELTAGGQTWRKLLGLN